MLHESEIGCHDGLLKVSLTPQAIRKANITIASEASITESLVSFSEC
jgi:hypothetical protein